MAVCIVAALLVYLVGMWRSINCDEKNGEHTYMSAWSREKGDACLGGF